MNENDNKNTEYKFRTTGQYLCKNTASDGVSVESYTLDVILENIVTAECGRIAEQLHRAKVSTDFDSENSVRLTYKQIIKKLDPVLAHNQIARREPLIGCIVKIYSTVLNQIERKMRKFRMFDMEKNGRTINIFNLRVDPHTATRFLEEQFGIKRAGNIGVQFKITCVENILESEHIERFHITFAKTYNNSKPREILLPRPHSDLRSFRIWGKTQEDIDPKAQILYDYLSFIYGACNIETTFLYDFTTPYEATNLDFSDNEWAEINDEISRLDINASAGYNNDGNGRFIFFEFQNENELKAKMEAISQLDKIEIAKSPLDEDFKFKVKIVSKNPDRQDAKMRKIADGLDGREFICHTAEGEPIALGRLNSADCNSHTMSFVLPYKSKANQENAQKLMDYISGNTITEIMENTGEPILSDNDDGWLSSIWSKVKGSFN